MSAKKLFFLLSIVFFILFIYFSYLVAKESFTQFDFDTTVKFQDRIPRDWDIPFSLLSLFGSLEVTSLFWLGVTIFVLLKRYWLTFLSLSLFVWGMAAEVFGKLLIHHPAPPFLFYRGILPFNFPTHYIQADYSYPSGHVFRTSFLITFLIGLLYFKVSPTKGLVFYISLLTFWGLMLISRVYLGEHWTSDVVGGLLLGISLGLFSASTIPLRRNVNHS